MKKTPFHDFHLKAGAKMVLFAGYEMPVNYAAGLIAEHKAVREGCGVFDVSHMGEFIVRGPDAVAFVNRVTTNDVTKLAVGQAHYTGILNDRGTFEDDGLVYRFADHIMMVVNASNAAKDFAHIKKELPKFNATLEDVSDETALLAVQGPKAEELIARLTRAHASQLTALKYYHFTTDTVAGIDNVIISRTGYTGEDGFELYFDVKHAAQMWNALMNTNAIQPIGLGARDTLRLEMGMALYGNDIDDTTTPLEAGLSWIVKMQKGEFTGKAALEKQKVAGVQRKLVAFTMSERGAIPRHGYPVFAGGAPSGTVCSGTMSPSLGIAIGTAYVPASHANEGSEIEVEIRGKRVAGKVVKTPFYKNASHK
ncbi:MAG TPA: glycine cleavage system aminomethyltransferase GcvT [Gemmatimonadaceae bacterium]|nr:glycine cleavage system aminomethyltransferase GcvT [Gemmatimonadaceae bacterium]